MGVYRLGFGVRSTKETAAAETCRELGYGLSLSDGLTGMPYAGFGLGEAGAQDYHLGWRLASDRLQSFSLGVEATRREAANDNGAGKAEHGVMLRSAIRW